MTFLARNVCLCLPAKKSACALKRKQIFTEQAVYKRGMYLTFELVCILSILILSVKDRGGGVAGGGCLRDKIC